jgi:hypothetical protein
VTITPSQALSIAITATPSSCALSPTLSFSKTIFLDGVDQRLESTSNNPSVFSLPPSQDPST